jgi:hypothetical protein
VKPKSPFDTFWETDCTSICKDWRKSIRDQLAGAICGDVSIIEVQKIGPRQYFTIIQLQPNNNHVIIEEWFGSACCVHCAAAKAYQDYYDNQVL